MPKTTRFTWTDERGDAWRVELVSDRWQLSRWQPAVDQWQRVGSYPTRQAALDASIAPDLDALLEERDQLIRRLVDRGGSSEGSSESDSPSSEEGTR
jgi:hypothetical protein